MEIEWGYAATAGLAPALFTHIVSRTSACWKSKRRAGRLALRLGVQLEAYGRKFGTAHHDAADKEETCRSDGGVTCPAMDFPELPGATEAWEHLKPALSHRVLAFSYLVAERNEAISQATRHYSAQLFS